MALGALCDGNGFSYSGGEAATRFLRLEEEK